MICPGINLLLHSDNIDQQNKNDLESYSYTKGIVAKADLIENTKINVSYDKSSHKLVYRYIINSSNSIDTLNETWSVYTYALKHVVPYKVNDTIDYYKSSNDKLPNLTIDRFTLSNSHKDFKFTRWFSIGLSLIGVLLVGFFTRQLLHKTE